MLIFINTFPIYKKQVCLDSDVEIGTFHSSLSDIAAEYTRVMNNCLLRQIVYCNVEYLNTFQLFTEFFISKNNFCSQKEILIPFDNHLLFVSLISSSSLFFWWISRFICSLQLSFAQFQLPSCFAQCCITNAQQVNYSSLSANANANADDGNELNILFFRCRSREQWGVREKKDFRHFGITHKSKKAWVYIHLCTLFVSEIHSFIIYIHVREIFLCATSQNSMGERESESCRRRGLQMSFHGNLSMCAL